MFKQVPNNLFIHSLTPVLSERCKSTLFLIGSSGYFLQNILIRSKALISVRILYTTQISYFTVPTITN